MHGQPVHERTTSSPRLAPSPRFVLLTLPACCLPHARRQTIHCINSAIVKTAKLQAAGVVYRGVSGGVLPPAFWQADAASNVRGGVEFSFLSTTVDRAVALGYAASEAADGKPGVVFEIQQGLVDRGVDLSWLSQYPHEKEICFGPLTGLEVHRATVDGPVLVLSMRCDFHIKGPPPSTLASPALGTATCCPQAQRQPAGAHD